MMWRIRAVECPAPTERYLVREENSASFGSVDNARLPGKHVTATSAKVQVIPDMTHHLS
jgi:hypothetical protein